tara:strand:- start:5213 stop:5407 length:195 start_codon:yes stop_codon:yes gene_type:complete
MPTDSALASGIFVGVCIGFADNPEIGKTKYSEMAKRTGVALSFGNTFMVEASFEPGLFGPEAAG